MYNITKSLKINKMKKEMDSEEGTHFMILLSLLSSFRRQAYDIALLSMFSVYLRELLSKFLKW